MTNKDWVLLISDEFHVSHTVAKGMLHAMFFAKDVLSVNSNYKEQEKNEEYRKKRLDEQEL